MMKSNQLYNSKTLILWLLACALTPVLSHIWTESLVSSFGKKYVYAELLNTLMIFGIFIIPFLIATLSYVPLRRIANKSFYGEWLVIGSLTLILVSFTHHYSDVFVSSSFRHFKSNAQWGAAYSWIDYVLNMHWLLLVAGALLCAAAYLPVSKITLQRSTGYKWWLFVLSAFLATLVYLLLAQSLDLLGLRTWYDSYDRWSLSSKSWNSRWLTLLEQGLCGAFWGWLSYTIFYQFVKKQSQSDKEIINSKLILISGLLVIISLAATHAMQHPYMIKKLSNNVDLALSNSPQKDVSTGKNILRFINTAQILPPVLPQYPVANFAPDSQSFVMLDSQRILQRIDVSSGKSLGIIGEPIIKDGRQETTWSASGRFFAFRTSAEPVTVGRGYTKHRSKIRLYDGANYKLLGEFTHRVDECFETYNPSIAFEGDKALWLTCAHEYTQQKSDNVMAIKLTLPDLTVQEVVRYGDYAAQHAVGGIASGSGHVYVWQDNILTDNKHIHLHDLTVKTKPLVLPDLTQSHLAGSLTQQFELIENGVMLIRFCGNDQQVSDPQVKEVSEKVVHGFCRTLGFDIKTGQLTLNQDEVKSNTKEIITKLTAKKHQYSFRATYKENSKQGGILIYDLKTGEKYQAIHSASQTLLKLSPNSKWLITHAPFENKIRIYQVNN